MSGADITVLVLSVLAVAGLGWYFFAPRKGRIAELGDGVQKIAVTVRGGYSPELIHVRQGVPLEIEFDRQESGECTNRVVFADLGVNAGLPAYTKTTVRLRPDRAGTFGFACGMNMIHGTLVVDPADETTTATAAEPVTAHLDAGDGGGSAAEAEAADMAERRAEIADLTRRVVIGALLTTPVLFAVMAHEFFRADWVPGLLLNHWVQLALITPVMFYTGWPIHRIGWLALAHRIRGDEFVDHARHDRRLRL